MTSPREETPEDSVRRDQNAVEDRGFGADAPDGSEGGDSDADADPADDANGADCDAAGETEPDPSGSDRVAPRHGDDLRRHRVGLAALNDFAREIRTAKAPNDAVARTCETLTSDLSFPFVTVQLYDGDRGQLVPARDPSERDLFSADSPLFAPAPDAPGWQTFIDGVEEVYDDILSECDAVDEDELTDPAPLRSCVFEPLGRFGVLVVGSPHPSAFTTTDIETISVVALTLQSALERLENEDRIADRTQLLDEKTDDVSRLERLNDTIRSIMRTLPEASTREEIAQSVCNHLAATDPYKLVWVGYHDATTDTVVPTAAAGDAVDYSKEVTVSTTAPYDRQEPMARALTEGETQVVPQLRSDPPFETWRKAALKRGLQSVIAVPLTYQDRNYGVLGVYARAREAFGETDVAVLTELGDIIAYAMTALDRKLALVGDRSIELEFDLSDSDLPMVQLVQATNSEAFEFETVVRNSNDTLRVFFAIRGRDLDLESAMEFAESKVIVENYSLLSQTDDALHFECTLVDPNILSVLLDHGAVPQRMSATDAGVRLTVEVPQNIDVRRFVSMLQSKYEQAELVARRQRERPIQTGQEFGTLLDDLLTERQLEVLKTAYFAGFFEWPREATGEEVAEMLDISQPTFARHVRRAERTLFESLFEPSSRQNSSN